jgi:hypothetical protein
MFAPASDWAVVEVAGAAFGVWGVFGVVISAPAARKRSFEL